MYCKKCGKESESGSDYCPNCGECFYNYDRKEYYGRGRRNVNKISQKKIYIVSFIIAVIFCISIVVNALLYNDSENGQNNATATASDAENPTPTDAEENTATYTDAEYESMTANEVVENIATASDAMLEINNQKWLDVAGASTIETAVEYMIFYASEEQINYMMSHVGEIIILSNRPEDDTVGAYDTLISILGGSIPEINYISEGASGWAYMITAEKEVYVWISTVNNITSWQMCPVVDDDYVID